MSLNNDATASFSWYLYQADVALLVTLEKIKEIWIKSISELENWSLEVEWEEDFTLIKSEDWKAVKKHLYQVKEYEDQELSKFIDATIKLFQCTLEKDNSNIFCKTYICWKKSIWWNIDKLFLKVINTKSDENLFQKAFCKIGILDLECKVWKYKFLKWSKKNKSIIKNWYKDNDFKKNCIKNKFEAKIKENNEKFKKNFSIWRVNWFWDYIDVETLINEKIKELKPTLETDINTVSYIREYLTIKIKKYLQEKSKNQKAWMKDKKTIPFISDEDENWLKKWIVSFLNEVNNWNIIDRFLQNEEFILDIIKNVLEKSIKKSDIKYRNFKNDFNEKIDKEKFLNIIEDSKSFLSEKIQDFWKKDLERIFIVLKIVWKSFNEIFEKDKIEFLDFCYNLCNLFDQNNLNRLIVNISIYCYKWDFDKIDNLFWKRIIIWDGNNIISNFIIDLVWNDFIGKFEHDDFIISSYNTSPFSFYNFDEKQKNNIEGDFENEEEKTEFERHVVKYKDVRICCFQCPYKMKHWHLDSWDCWKTSCDLHNN